MMAWARGRLEGYGLRPKAIELATAQGVKLRLKRQTAMGMNHVIMYRDNKEWFREWNVQSAWHEAILRLRMTTPRPPAQEAQ